MQPCFYRNPRIILYLNCFNKKKKMVKPLNTCIFPLFRGMIVSLLFFLNKKNPNLKIKTLFPERKIVSILQQKKNLNKPFYPHLFF